MLKSTDAAVQFADMERLQASGAVEVFLHQQHAQADAMDYDPATATAYLSGSPRLSQGLYQVSGHSMQLNRRLTIQGTRSAVRNLAATGISTQPLQFQSNRRVRKQRLHY